jgi:PST family polysaccharide transporter
MTAPESEPSLKEAATTGFLFTGGQVLIVRAFSLISFVVLARLLEVADFGVASLGVVFVSFLQMLAAGGFAQALVQRIDVERDELDSVFWFSVSVGVLLSIALGLAAWPLAHALDEPQLRPVLQVLAVNLIAVGATAVPQATLLRRLAFRQIAIGTVAANFIATALGISFAFAGLGVWALVVQTVASITLLAVFMFVASGYRPSLSLQLARVRGVATDSKHYLGIAMATFINARTDSLLIGSVLGAHSLGIYSVAFQVVYILVEVLTFSTRQVVFPLFSRVQHDKRRLLRAYTTATRLSALVAVPIFAFGMAAAEELVEGVFGRQWHSAVHILQILCLAGPLQCIQVFNFTLLNSRGRSRTVFWFSVASCALQVAAFLISVSFGLTWVALALVIRLYLMAPIILVIASRELGSNVWLYVRQLTIPTVCAAVMGAAVTAVRLALRSEMPPLALLFVLGAVGTVVYVGMLRFVFRSAWSEVASYITATIGRSKLQGRAPSSSTGEDPAVPGASGDAAGPP